MLLPLVWTLWHDHLAKSEKWLRTFVRSWRDDQSGLPGAQLDDDDYALMGQRIAHYARKAIKMRYSDNMPAAKTIAAYAGLETRKCILCGGIDVRDPQTKFWTCESCYSTDDPSAPVRTHRPYRDR